MNTGTSITLNAQTSDKDWMIVYYLIVREVSKYFSISSEDQGDIANEIITNFLEVFQRRSDKIDNLEGYIFMSVRNAVKSWQKKQQDDKKIFPNVNNIERIEDENEENVEDIYNGKTDEDLPLEKPATTYNEVSPLITAGSDNESELSSDKAKIVKENEDEELPYSDLIVKESNNNLSKKSFFGMLDETLVIGKEFKEYIDNANIYQALQIEYKEDLENLPKSKDHSKYRQRGLIFMKRFCIERYPALLWHLGNLKQVLDELKQSAIKNTVPLVEHSSPQENDSLAPEEHTQEDNNSLQEDDSLTPEEYTQEDNNKEKKTQSYTLNDVLEVERLMKESGKMKGKGKANIPQEVYNLICDEIFKKINFA